VGASCVSNTDRVDGEKSRLIRVLVVSEFPIFCEAICCAISREADLECVGTAQSSSDAVDFVTRAHPDVAVIDIDTPTAGDETVDGIDVAKAVKSAHRETRILVLAARLELETMTRAATEGACGFLSKLGDVDELIQAIRTAKDGGIYVESELVGPLLDAIRVRARRVMSGGSGAPDLTDREAEVLALLGEGLDVTVIARRLGITLHTCRGHVKNVLLKLDSHSQLEAVVEAVRRGALPHLGP